MSLKLTNRLTTPQRELLVRLDYLGKWDLTVEEAAALIQELIEQRRQEEDIDQSVPDWIKQGED